MHNSYWNDDMFVIVFGNFVVAVCVFWIISGCDSGITPVSLLRFPGGIQGKHIQCHRSNSGSPCARQALYLLNFL